MLGDWRLGALQRGVDHDPGTIEKDPYWHLIPFSVFLILNGIICWIWYRELALLPKFITPFSVLLWSLAVYRIANIVSNEQVTRVIRAPFVEQETQEDGKVTETPKRRGFKHTIGSLLYCPSCVGVWVAATLTYMVIFFPFVAWVVVVVFALSGLERIFTTLVAALARPDER